MRMKMNERKPMAEYIERRAAIEALENEAHLEWGYLKIAMPLLKTLEALPAADVAQVVHGRWEHLYLPMSIMPHKCSICGCTAPCHMKGRDLEEYLTDYCPHCGAKMDGGES